MINPSYIACFLSAARTGSFSDTARELYVTRQAVSKSIQEMEREVGFPLFHRNYLPLSLTAAGAKLFEYYSGLDYDLSGAKRIFGNGILARSHLRIGWGGWMRPESRHLDLLNEFAKTQDVQLSVVLAQEKQLLDYLREGEIDVGIFSRYLSSFLREPFTANVVCELPMQLGVAQNKLTEDDISVENLIGSLPYLACVAGEDIEDEVVGRVNRELFKFRRLPPRVDVVRNVETAFLQVLLGNGVCCSPSVRYQGGNIAVIPMERKVSMCIVSLNRNHNPNIERLRLWWSEKEA